MTRDNRVTAAEIARTVGVGRAAVSNWRRRYLDFPKPVGGTPSSPTFAWDEVEAWLKANGRLSRPAEQPADSADDMASPAPLDDSLLARTVAGLVPALDGGLVLDPACGSGWLLASVAVPAKADVAFAGQDADAGAVETARDGFDDAGRVPAVLKQGDPFISDSLAEFRMGADAVVCAPPIGAQGPSRPIPLDRLTLDPRWEFGLPAPADPVGIWAQICYSYLKPGGTAILLLPAAYTLKASGRRIRAELVRRGAMHTVIGLPHRFSLRISGGLHIWVLQRPSGAPDHQVRMVDLSEADDLPESRSEWAAVFDDPARTRTVGAIDLLDDEVALVPARHVRLPMSDMARLHRETASALEPMLRRVIAETPLFQPTTNRTELPLISISELQRAGALQILGRDAGIRSGDVVIPADSHPVAITGPDDLDEVHRRGGPVEIIRCDPEQLDPYFVAGFLLPATYERQGTAGSGISLRSAVKKSRVPRIPLFEQQRYSAAFQRISRWTAQFDAARRAGQELTRWAVHGLTTGVLDPDTPAKR
ncbi:N-6 DNA methylase [Actinomadura chokoriensis]|uniref:N-6 DNA methylase n=1 Tax=Actinomadura chokoriensis TaxID=454156 RepID=UPI0031F8430B